jgi:lysozyme
MRMAILGIDVSGSWQGQPDWTRVAAAGTLFAFAKATEGMTFTDGSFAYNWQGIKAAGLVRGAYHLARPSNNTAESEADHFLAQVNAAGGLQTGDLVALDVEDTNTTENLHDWTLAWLQRVEAQIGFKPLLYSGTWYMDPHGLSGVDDLAAYPLWFSSYNNQFDNVPAAPPNWTQILIHQYTEQGTVDGIEAKVDLDCFTGDTVDELAPYGCPSAMYTVQPGDTWDSIADAYGISVEDLQAANPIIVELEPGITLVIPTSVIA